MSGLSPVIIMTTHQKAFRSPDRSQHSVSHLGKDKIKAKKVHGTKRRGCWDGKADLTEDKGMEIMNKLLS